MKKQTEITIQNEQQTGSPALASGKDLAVSGVSSHETALPAAAYAGDSDPNAAADLETLRAENELLKTTIRQTEAHRRLTGELTKAGARSPELLFATVKQEVQFAGDGSVVNAAALVGRLKSSFPEQFGFERPTGSIDGGAGVTVQPRLTKAALAKMKPAEIAALDWADVRKVLANS